MGPSINLSSESQPPIVTYAPPPTLVFYMVQEHELDALGTLTGAVQLSTAICTGCLGLAIPLLLSLGQVDPVKTPGWYLASAGVGATTGILGIAALVVWIYCARQSAAKRAAIRMRARADRQS
jgi:hypothetical protein